jgi:nitroreductase
LNGFVDYGSSQLLVFFTAIMVAYQLDFYFKLALRPRRRRGAQTRKADIMFISLLEKRRSIRRYLEKPVPPEMVDLLIEAALRSPSSMGANPWEFIIVKDRSVLDTLSKAKPHGATFLKNAPLGIVVCADPEKSTVWIEDVSIASILIHLAAESNGLGSCWIQIRDRMHSPEMTSEAYISKVLNIPERIRVEAIIAVGYPAEKKTGHSREELQYEKIFFGTYGKPYRP